MPLLPMKQTITVIKASLDEWGQPTGGESLTYNCRIDQASKLVANTNGQEVVSSFNILLDGLVTIDYSDIIEWVGAGNRLSRKPISIAVIRDFAGKPLLTKVVV